MLTFLPHKLTRSSIYNMGYYHPGAFMKLPPDSVFFITITVIDWVDVFTREDYKRIIVESLDFCRRKKGLRIHGWVLMTNHLHLIASHEEDYEHLARVIGDFKKFTAKQIIKAIIENPKESRKKWILEHFKETTINANDDASCSRSKSNHGRYVPVAERNVLVEGCKPSTKGMDEHYHLWQRGYDSYCVYNIKHLRQKMGYLHTNPVRAGIVDRPWEYRYSSYRNYCGGQGLLEIDLLDLGIEDTARRNRFQL